MERPKPFGNKWNQRVQKQNENNIFGLKKYLSSIVIFVYDIIKKICHKICSFCLNESEWNEQMRLFARNFTITVNYIRCKHIWWKAKLKNKISCLACCARYGLNEIIKCSESKFTVFKNCYAMSPLLQVVYLSKNTY